MLPLKVFVFSEQGDRTPIKMDGPGDPESRTVSRLWTEMMEPHGILQSRLNNYPNFLNIPQKIPVPMDKVSSLEKTPTFSGDGI